MRLTEREWGEMPAEEFKQKLLLAPDHLRPAMLRLRFRYDIKGFARYCWPERFNLPFNEMHDDLISMADIPPWRERTKPDVLDARAAPRGFGKSMITSFLLVAHAIVYDLEAYIIIMSSGQRLARSFSRNLVSQFRSEALHDTRRFTQLYGPFKVTGGTDEWQVVVGDRPDSVGVLTSSFGQDIRGAQHPERGIRPTLVIMDDAEKKDRVRNPDQREVWESTLQKDILKLSDRARGSAIRFVGTILHIDSTLARRENDPGWTFKKYKAILSWPKNRELWRQCHKIWANLRLGRKRRDYALQFYEENKAAMDEGVELLDPDVTNIFALYEVIWGQGLGSFLQEMQNDPIDPNAQIFFSDRFARFEVHTDDNGEKAIHVLGDSPRVVPYSELRMRFIRWDPAKGDPAGDYAALAVLARDMWGYKYVLDVWMDKRPPSVQLETLWALAEKWDVRKSSIESNNFQELAAEPFQRQKKERLNSGRFSSLQIDARPSTENKVERISTLEPEITNGWLLFNTALPELLFRQFDAHPNGDTDDGPDAIQGASVELGAVVGGGMRE